MDILHTGFDTLHVAWRGCVSRSVVDKLEAAKERAGQNGEPSYETVGELTGHVAQTGARGGYRYIFDLGPLESKWLIKRSDDPQQWNLFCQIGSQALAEKGVVQCINDMKADLRIMDAKITGHSVNRWDVCADIIVHDGFEIERANILCHSHSSVATHEDDFHLSVHGGGRIDTITIGKMPSRQIQIYDKRKEHVRSGKTHWWKLWGREDDKTPIWRIECRFGKLHNDSWNLKTLEDLATIGGDVVRQAMDDIRYLQERDRVNVSRSATHEIWHFAKAKLLHLLATGCSGAKRGKVRLVMREDAKKCMTAQFAGVATSSIALGIQNISEIIEGLSWDAAKERLAGYVYREFILKLPDKKSDYLKKLNAVNMRYHYLEERPLYA